MCISDFYKEKLAKKNITQLVPNKTLKGKKKAIDSIQSLNVDDVDDVPSSKKCRLQILNVDLPTEKAIVLKRITAWIKENAMDIFNDEYRGVFSSSSRGGGGEI